VLDSLRQGGFPVRSSLDSFLTLLGVMAAEVVVVGGTFALICGGAHLWAMHGPK
jgi:hypothetical protein